MTQHQHIHYSINLYSMNLVIRLWFGLWFVSAVCASVTFEVNNQTFTYPTYDPYGVQLDPYTATGILVMPSFQPNTQCTLQLNETQLAAIKPNSSSTPPSSTIIVIDDKEAYAHNCLTVANTCRVAAQYGRQLEKLGWPSVSTALYLLSRIKKGDAGGPYSVEYSSQSSSIPDGRPELAMAMVPYKYYDEVSSLLKRVNGPLYATIKEETGPWNEMLFSNGYQAFLWIVFTIHTIFILWSLATITLLRLTNNLWAEWRTYVFITGIIALTLFTITIPMDSTTFAYKQIRGVSALLFNTAFYLLSLIWCSIYVAVTINRSVLVIRIIVYISLIIQTPLQIIKSLSYFLPLHFTANFWPISNYIGMSLRIIASLLFFYYGKFSFYWRINEYSDNATTRKAFTQLSRTAFACSFGFLVNASTNTMPLFYDARYTIPGVVAYVVIGVINNMVGAIVLQSELGLRMPLKITNANQCSHFLDVFALYRLWRESGKENVDGMSTQSLKHANDNMGSASLSSTYPAQMSNSSKTAVQNKEEDRFAVASSFLQSGGYGNIHPHLLSSEMETIIDEEE
ncbi:hypothetical protein BDF19DRAFT_456323 [Syncephalis fuscata]|nr:hypothetical protein BDF19DRAFT_456323 [Syncephalis fuscata]